MGKIANTTRGWSLTLEQKRQMLAFDAEFEEMEVKVRNLETQVLDLEKKVNPLEREVERFKKQVEEQKSPSHDDLDDMAVKLLAAFVQGQEQIRERIKALFLAAELERRGV